MQTRGNGLLKKLDYYIGVPLLYLLGMFRTKQKTDVLPNNPRVLLLKTAGIGDTVISSVVIDNIKKQYPKAHITYICSKANSSAVDMLYDIDEKFVFDMKHPVNDLLHVHNLPDFDLLIDMAPWARINAIISFMANAKYKIGFKRANMHRHYIYDAYVDHSDKKHEADNFRELLSCACVENVIKKPRLKVLDKQFITSDCAVFHPYPAGSSVEQRTWSNEKWIELAKQVYNKYHLRILFSGGKEDTGNAEKLAKELVKSGITAESIAGKYQLSEMPTVLSQARLLVSVNTGIMHMGAAVDIPLVALHGATSDLRWGPLSDRAVVVKSGEACQPCISLGFETKCTNPVCMQNITVDMVMNAVDQIFKYKM